jgi:hypothetical protein
VVGVDRLLEECANLAVGLRLAVGVGRRLMLWHGGFSYARAKGFRSDY